jgi:hypothetical protein
MYKSASLKALRAISRGRASLYSPINNAQKRFIMGSTTTISPASLLRWQIANKDEIVVCPGVYDGLSARIALHAGFKSLYMVSLKHFSIEHLIVDLLIKY